MAEHRRGGLYVIPTPVYLRKKVAMPPEFFFIFCLNPRGVIVICFRMFGIRYHILVRSMRLRQYRSTGKA